MLMDACVVRSLVLCGVFCGAELSLGAEFSCGAEFEREVQDPKSALSQ